MRCEVSRMVSPASKGSPLRDGLRAKTKLRALPVNCSLVESKA